MPYKVAVEYWTKLPACGVKLIEVIAALFAQRLALKDNKRLVPLVALVSVTPSQLKDLSLLLA